MSLQAQEVGLRKGGRALLDNISLNLSTGRFHAIIGPNGAGKSMLLRCFAGWERPQQGQILIDDAALTELNAKTLAQKRAVVGQESEPAFNFNAAEIVALGLTAVPRPGIGSYSLAPAREALRQVGLQAKAAQAFATLSGGERQRVHLARALLQLNLVDLEAPEAAVAEAQESRWLLVDEPTNALDLYQQQAMLRLLQQLSRRPGVGVCAILHDLNLAAAYADHIWALRDGRLFAEGDCATVLTAETLGDLFDLDVHRRPPEGSWAECFQAAPRAKSDPPTHS